MYRSRGSADYAERKAEGQLGSARKTVLDLDGRDDKGVRRVPLYPLRRRSHGVLIIRRNSLSSSRD